MTDLQMFLLDNPVTTVTKEVIVSERLKDKPFKISCMTGKQLDEYQKQCIKNFKNIKKREIDTSKLNELVIINHCITPNFRDAEWLQKAGCPTDPRALLYRVLNAGEIITLVSKIYEISGFTDDEFEDEKEEIKNA